MVWEDVCEMIIIAIDQSLSETGICIMDTKTERFKTGVIKPKKLRDMDRLLFLEKEIEKILVRHINRFGKENISGIMEGYSYGSVGRTFELGELGGIIKVMFKEYDIPLEIVPPTKWKKIIVGKGNYNKYRIMLEVERLYGIEFKNNNECDAYCLARYLKIKIDGGE